MVLADAGGSPTTSLEMSGSAQATPGAEDIEVPRSVDWSPQGDRILAQLHSGQIFQIETRTGATPVELDVGDVSGRIITPAWSPTGQDIAYIAESDDGATRSLGILDVQTGETAIVVAPQQGRLVVDFAWLPDGVSLLFTEGGVPGSAITGIDLWRVDANGENRALVASAGTVAPVARIANLSPSPDGRSVAYAVLVPGRAAPVLDSVWVRNLESGVGFRIPVPSVASLEQIWWTDEGLVISVVTQGTPGGRSSTQALLQVSSDGTMSALWAAPTAAATPTSATPAGERGST